MLKGGGAVDVILLGGSQVVRLGSVCVAPLGTSPLGARAIRGSLRGALRGVWLLRACGRGRAKCGDPGGRKGPVAAWGEAVHLPPEGCVTARGSYWNVWPGDLDLLRLMEPTGGPAYRSTAMVAVIRAKGVLLFALSSFGVYKFGCPETVESHRGFQRPRERIQYRHAGFGY